MASKFINKVKYFALLAIALIASLTAKAETDNVLSIADIASKAGEQVVLSVNMNNTASITGFQFDLYLPEGITIAKDTYGDEVIELSAARTSLSRHSVSWSQQADGAMRVACTSLKNNVFTGTEGEVLTITLNIASDIETGDYTLTYKKIELTTPTLVQYKTEELTSKLYVPVIEPCAAPTIEYVDGKILCTSETEGAECYKSLDANAYTNEDGEVIITLTVTTYAVADGYSKSENVTKTFTIKPGDMNGDGELTVSDVTKIVNKILKK